MAKKWHKKHISTKWGIVAVVGFFLVMVVILMQVISQKQSVQSNAMYEKGDGGLAKLKCKLKNSPIYGFCAPNTSSCKTVAYSSSKATGCPVYTYCCINPPPSKINKQIFGG